MEREAVKDMYTESKNFGMQYQYLVGEDLLTKRNPAEFDEWVKKDVYKKWADDHESLDHCNAVRKMDCIQHVGK